MTLIAHSGRDGGRPQPLIEHLANVAALAEGFAGVFGSGDFAAWLGWWHDAGKAAPDVQAYLNDPDAKPPGPDHSSAGMLAALEVLEPLAFNIAGHHGGLADYGNLKSRIERKRQEQRVLDALEAARPLLCDRAPSVQPSALPPFIQRSAYAQEFWLRMLHSTLVDADCLDTERHFDPGQADLRQRDGDVRQLWDLLRQQQDAFIARSEPTDVNHARAEIYRACVAAAEGRPGVYSLTVPTGGGKTRSAMAFALCHAVRHDLRRVVVALPYTSIIEQNADVYRELFGDEAVLEHHSAVSARETPGDEAEAERRARLAAENWDAPVVVTTTVQLLESLFTNRNSRLRKLHRLAKSVIVLDEVQTLPPNLLASTLDVLRHLVDAYGVTVLLCTATPPALAARDGFDGFADVTEVIDDPRTLFRRLKRVAYEVEDEPWDWDRVAAEMVDAEQAMAVLNTKRDADALLEALAGEDDVLHLSTNLCGAHRRAVLADVRQRLAEGRPVRLVATQVVEAGVDIDFPLVLRALGPLDRIVQAAGRCNREGRLAAGRVVVFRPVEGGLPPGAYRAGAQVTEALFAEDPDLDLDDPASALTYFHRLYDTRNLDAADVQNLRRRLLYEQTARAYRLIEDDTVAVAVSYGDCEAVLDRIERRGFAMREDYRALQPYLVNLRESAHRDVQGKGICTEVAPGVWKWSGRYDELRGLMLEGPILNDYVV